VTILAGRSLTLSCFADGKPEMTVQIFKGVQQLTPIQDGNHTSVTLSNLFISDSGVYRCEANNSYGIDMRKISVSVIDPPIIVNTGIGDIVNKYVEDTVMLTCNTTGYPTPSVVWKYGQSTQGVGVQDDGQSLVIRNATVNHGGNYTCIATNTAGNASRTFTVDISSCRPTLTMHGRAPCLYTIFLVEESQTMALSRQGLQDLASELDKSLIRNGIGTRKGNYFSVIGFGTKRKARVIYVRSDTVFSHNRVNDAISQLNSTGEVPDGYQAIETTVKRLRSVLKSNKAKRCPTNFILVTSEAPSRASSLTVRKIRKRLCYKAPVIFNAILNVSLAVKIGGGSSVGIGLDWRGISYVRETTSNREWYRRQEDRGLEGHLYPDTSLSPITVSACSSFRDYGDLALRARGAIWDIGSTFSLQDRSTLFSALTNSTISSLEMFQPCTDCRCKKANDGREVKTCYWVKNNDLCKCRMNGDSVREFVIRYGLELMYGVQ
jgi:hypothetical protein